jgi:hypothetical protein
MRIVSGSPYGGPSRVLEKGVHPEFARVIGAWRDKHRPVLE